jgi:tryptophan 2,3-dioxygenase
MAIPVPWNGDPACGHEVAEAYQTHYCTYIRVPKLLTLQGEAQGEALLLVTAYQWYELWLRVLLADAGEMQASPPHTYAPVKLLRRGIELLRLFDQHADLCETVLVRELGLRQAVAYRGEFPPSEQFRALEAWSRALSGLVVGAHDVPGVEAAADEYRARLLRFARRYRTFARATLVRDEGAPCFAEWLCLDELLDLQQAVKSDWAVPGAAPTGHWQPEQVSADETMFVVVHQCFEVWFKVILDLMDRAIPALQADDVQGATPALRRAVLVQRLLVPQIQIPATMLPLDFMRFRDQTQTRAGQAVWTGLSPASGTESFQFREIEIVCGLRDDPVFQRYLEGTDQLPIRLLTPRQRERMQATTLPEAFRAAVARRGIDDLKQLYTPADVPNPHLDLAILADVLIEFDEFFRFWRLGHVTMVEKMIGARSGTGFLGPEYLAETAGIKLQEKNRVFAERQVRPRFFEALWEVRGRLRGG